MTDLPDVNVWFALAVSAHPQHARAAAYWQEKFQSPSPPAGASRIAFCRVTMLGLVRLLAQPKAMGEHALSPKAAFDVYAKFLATPGIALLPDAADLDSAYAAMLEGLNLPPRMLTDAYLAAFALSAQLRLVTFDRDFTRFKRVDVAVLPAI